MKKIGMLGVLGLLLIGLVAVGAYALPFGKGSFGRNEAAQNALDSDNFEAWKEAKMGELTEENFQNLLQMRQNRNAQREQMQANRKLIETAIENDDYDAWKAVVESLDPVPHMAENILTQDDFNKLVELHNARKSGDIDKEHGLKGIHGFKQWFGRGKMRSKGILGGPVN